MGWSHQRTKVEKGNWVMAGKDYGGLWGGGDVLQGQFSTNLGAPSDFHWGLGRKESEPALNHLGS